MKSKMAAMAAVLVVLAITSVSRAGPMLSLTSLEPDLNNLTVGQTVSFQVELSGLDPGDKLEYLAAQMVYDSTLLSSPTIVAGSIVPDLDGFTGSSFADTADGNYDSWFSPTGAQITSNGVFFTFSATALNTGSGTVSVGFADSLGSTESGDLLDPVSAGSPLSFASSSPNAVPEPGTGILLVLGVTSLAGWRYWRRREGSS